MLFLKKKVLSSTLALSMALGTFATLGTPRTYAAEQKNSIQPRIPDTILYGGRVESAERTR